VKHILGGRTYLDDALRWLDIHGGEGSSALSAHWRALDMSDVLVETPPRRGEGRPGGQPARSAGPAGTGGPTDNPVAGPAGEGSAESRPRRRRRRRRRRPRPSTAPSA
jgi:hypothetical protein